MTDEHIISLARNAKNSDNFRELWAGDIDSFYERSQADIALCGVLAFYSGGDAEQIERVFARSELGKDERWKNSKHYRDKTIERAIGGTAKFYEPAAANVLDLAEADCKLPTWKAAFNLARRLRTLAVDHPEQFESEVNMYCERADRDFDEFFAEFLVVWDVVRKPEGDNVLAWAKRRNEEQPWVPCLSKGRYYSVVGGIAYHMNTIQPGEAFWLHQEGIARLLGVSQKSISNVVKLLVKDKVLNCTAKYSYKDGKCSEYVFRGESSDVTAIV